MMEIAMNIVIAILVFEVLIFIHELGHFIAGKMSNIQINEFSLGMGPKLIGFQKGETNYTLRLLPIGGYVAFEGEDENSDNPRAMGNVNVWKRIVTVVAGAFLNIVLGFIIVLIITSMTKYLSTNVVSDFKDTAMSVQTGLQVNDEIYEINGNRIYIDNDIIFELSRTEDAVADVTVVREGEKILLEDVQFGVVDVDGKKYTTPDFYLYGTEKTFFSVISQSFSRTLSIVKIVWVSVLDLVTGQLGFNDLSGPVGVTGAIGSATSSGMLPFLLLVAFITINLGVFNLLPIPALDGGRLVFLVIEAIIRKSVPAKIEKIVHATGFILLMLLMVVVLFSDIIKLF